MSTRKTLSDPSVRLLSILRKSEGLVALLNRPRYTQDQIAQARRSQDDHSLDWSNAYELYECPLKELPALLFPHCQQVLASWNHLSHVRDFDATTLFHLLIILLETVPVTVENESVLLPLGLTPKAHPPTATAAHPRAYKGTKYHPPKPKRMPPLNLRPYLGNRRERQHLLRHLRPYLATALLKLASVGYAPMQLSRVEQTFARSSYSFVIGLPDDTPQVSVSHLPLPFLQSLFPSIKGLIVSEIREYLVVFHSLSLGDDHTLRNAVSRLVSLQNSSATRAWCRIVRRFPAQRLRLSSS